LLKWVEAVASNKPAVFYLTPIPELRRVPDSIMSAKTGELTNSFTADIW
jgi:hypothetical protein